MPQRVFRRALTGALLICVFTSSGLAQKKRNPEIRTDQPLWRFDLHSVGYSAFEPAEVRAVWSAVPEHTDLSFSNADTLIATFVGPNRVPALAIRGKVDSRLAYAMHGVVLDVNTGKVKTTHTWPLVHPTGGVIGLGDGTFVVLTASAVTRDSPDFEVLGEVKKSDVPADENKWLSEEFAVSPDAKLLLTQYVWQPNEKTAHVAWRWFELPSFQPLHWYNDDASPVESHVRRQKFTGTLTFSDKQVAITRTDNELRSCAVLMSDWGGAWKPAASPRHFGRDDSYCERPQFVADGLLALISAGGLRVIRTANGKIVLQDHCSGNMRMAGRFFPPLRSSLDGSRVAVPVWRYETPAAHAHPLTGYSLNEVRVYDLHAGERVYRLRPADAPLRSVSAIAVSPDGALLAIVTGGVVEVYRVP